MTKNTGMNGREDKAGKTAGLSASKASAVNTMLKNEANAPAPTKTISMVKKARENKKNK